MGQKQAGRKVDRESSNSTYEPQSYTYLFCLYQVNYRLTLFESRSAYLTNIFEKVLNVLGLFVSYYLNEPDKFVLIILINLMIHLTELVQSSYIISMPEVSVVK